MSKPWNKIRWQAGNARLANAPFEHIFDTLQIELRTNIDDVRAEIMRLENASIWDCRAWLDILAVLANDPHRLADAQRRMMTAWANATVKINEHLLPSAVAAETEVQA